MAISNDFDATVGPIDERVDEALSPAAVAPNAIPPLEAEPVLVAQAEGPAPAIITIAIEAGGIVRLPEGASIDMPRANGNNLEFVQPDGTVIVIPDGAVTGLTIFIGGVEIPASTVAELFSENGIQTAAGPAGAAGPNSSGGNFAEDVPDIGPGLPWGGLLPPTALAFGRLSLDERGAVDSEPILLLGDLKLAVDEEGLRVLGGAPFDGNNDDSYSDGGDAPGQNRIASDTFQVNYQFNAPHNLSAIELSALGATWTQLTAVSGILKANDGSWEAEVDYVSETNNVITYELEFKLLKPSDHPERDTEDDITVDITVTARDIDGDEVSGVVPVTIDDDAPIEGAAGVSSYIVDEDDIDTDLPDGSQGTSPNDGPGDGSYTDDPDNNNDGPAFIYGNLVSDGAILFGADGPENDPGKQAFMFQSPDGGNLAAQLELVGLRSNDDHLTYQVINTPDADGWIILRGLAGNNDRAVFELKVRAVDTDGGGSDKVGDFEFRLYDQLDHDSVQGQNFGLHDHIDGFDVDALPFGQILLAFDDDGDSKFLGDTFTIAVRDDVPKLVKHEDEVKAVNEDDIATWYKLINGEEGSAGTSPNDGNADGSYTDDPGNNNIGPAHVFGSLAHLVEAGADEHLTFSFLDAATVRAKLVDLGLTSKDGELSYEVQNGKIVAFVDNDGGTNNFFYDPTEDRRVFELTLNPDGTYNFRLYDQLDHDAPGDDLYDPDTNSDENIDLQDSEPGDVTHIDFGELIKATDHDGDSVILDNVFRIKVIDDVPELVPHKHESKLVNEDDIDTTQSEGTSPHWHYPNDPENDGDDSHTRDYPGPNNPAVVSGSLAYLVKTSADENLTFSFIDEDALRDKLEDLGLTSKDGVLNYDVQGNVLYGFVNKDNPNGEIYNEGDDRLVFKLILQPNGSYEFELYDQLDHDPYNDGPDGFGNGTGADENLDLQDDKNYDVDSIDFGSVIKATDHDGDSVILKDAFSIQIKDDVPELKKHAEEERTVDENDIATWNPANATEPGSAGTSPNDGGNSDTGNPPSDTTGPAFIDGSLANLVESGADEDLVFSFIGTNDIRSYLNSLGLKSQGKPISYEVDHATGEIIAFVETGIAPNGDPSNHSSYDPQNGDRKIFVLRLDDNGDYEFELWDQLDHDPYNDSPDGNGNGVGADENTDLVDKLGGSQDVEYINFGKLIKATDHDGDSVILDDAFKIRVKDDIPQVERHNPEIKLVNEDDISNGQSAGTSPHADGNPDPDAADGDDSYTAGGNAVVTGSLASVVDAGADEPVTFTFIDEVALRDKMEDLGLKSKGDLLSYDLQGNVLWGFANFEGPGGTTYHSGHDRPVFKLTLNQDGTYTFELIDQLDHDAPGDDGAPPVSSDENTDLQDDVNGDVNSIDFGSIIKATDFDGDGVTLDGAFKIQVKDDVPQQKTDGTKIAAGVEEDGMSLATGDHHEGNKQLPGDTNADDETSSALAGTLNTLIVGGADESITYSLKSSAAAFPLLMSHGQAVSYTVVGNELRATNYLGDRVFTLTVNNNGTWTFDLSDQLDHVDDAPNAENYDLLLSGGGSVSSIDFSSMIVVKDYDGDALDGLAPGSFTITVQDDVLIVGDGPANGEGANLIQNGGFEEGHGLGPNGWNNFHNLTGGWESTDIGAPGNGDDIPFELQHNNAANPPAHSGNVKLELDADPDGNGGGDINQTNSTNATVQQTVATTNGQNYVLRFWYAPRENDGDANSSSMDVLINGQVVHSIDSSTASAGWQEIVINFAATGPSTTIGFRGTGQENRLGAFIDDVSLHATNIVTVDEDGLIPPAHSTGNADAAPGDDQGQLADDAAFGIAANESTATGSLNITWGSDSVDTGTDGLGAGQTPLGGFNQDAIDAGSGDRSVTFNSPIVSVSGITPPLMSHGDVVSYSLNADKTVLTATAGNPARTVFEVSLSDDDSGAFRFVLFDQLDHAPGQAENNLFLNFDFTATDSDGDEKTGTFTVNVDDDMPALCNTDPACLDIKEGGEVQPGQDANFVIVLDTSGSVEDQLAQIKANAINLIEDLAASGGENIRVHIVDFADNSSVVGTFNLRVGGETQDDVGDVQGDQLQAAIDAINALTGGGSTNYEAGLAQAKEWIEGGTVNVTNAHSFDADTDSGSNTAYVLTDANGVRIAVVSAWEPFGSDSLDNVSLLSGPNGFGVKSSSELNESDEMLRFDFGAFDDFDDGGEFGLAGEATGFRGSDISQATFSFRSFNDAPANATYEVFYTDGSSLVVPVVIATSPLENVAITAPAGMFIAYVEFTVPGGESGRIDLESVVIGDRPILDADVNKVIFISDGEPNQALDNNGNSISETPAQDALDQAQNEIDDIETDDAGDDQAFEIEAFGVGVSNVLAINGSQSFDANSDTGGSNVDNAFVLSSNGVAVAIVSAWENDGSPPSDVLVDADSSDADEDGVGVNQDDFYSDSGELDFASERLRFDFGDFNDFDNGGVYARSGAAAGFDGPDVKTANFVMRSFGGGDHTVLYKVFYTDGTDSGASFLEFDFDSSSDVLTVTAPGTTQISYIEFRVPVGDTDGRVDLQSVVLAGDPPGMDILDQIDSNDADNLAPGDNDGVSEALNTVILALGEGAGNGGPNEVSIELGLNVKGGADDPLTFTMLTDTGGLPALKSGGADIVYTVVGNMLTATKGLPGDTVFTLELEADGTATFTLIGNLDHDGEDFLHLHFDSIIQAADFDLDALQVPLCIKVENDLEPPPPPVIELRGDIVHDESAGLQNGALPNNSTPWEDDADGDVIGTSPAFDGKTVAQLFANVVVTGNDTHVAPDTSSGESAIGYARYDFIHGTPPVDATRSFALTTTADGTASGVSTTEGVPVFMYAGPDGTLVGRLGEETVPGSGQYVADADGTVAFALAIDPETGELFIAQYLSLHHGDAGVLLQHDDREALEPAAVQVVATDTNSAGSTASTTAIGDRVLFADDGPHVEMLIDLGQDNAITEGQTVTGTWPADGGADGVLEYTFTFEGATATSVSGAHSFFNYGGVANSVLTFNPDGTWSFYAPPNSVTADKVLTFSVTVTDKDGDTHEAEQTINLTNVTVLAPADADALVYENALDPDQDVDDLAPGTVTGSLPGSTAETDTTGALNASGGVAPLTYTAAVIPGTYGTIQIFANGTYIYTLTKNHLDGLADNAATTISGLENFAYTVTDGLGNTASGNITVSIVDDVPTLTISDPASGDLDADVGEVAVNEGAAMISGNWMHNTGADGAPAGVQIAFNAGSFANVTYGVGYPITEGEAVGTLVINNDGTWTFTPVANLVSNQTFTFTLKVTDGDGDVATDSIEITVKNVPVIPTYVVAEANHVVLDEDGFTGSPFFANADGSAPGLETDANELVVNTGTIVVNYGNDQPADLDAAFEFLDTPSLDTHLQTTDGTPVLFEIEVGTGDLIGKAGTDVVIRLEITGAVPNGSGQVTYTYKATLSEPLKHTTNNTEDSDVLPVQFQVTDSDLTQLAVPGTFNVTVHDDIPLADDDGLIATVSEGAGSTNVGPVSLILTGDSYGADGAHATTPITFAAGNFGGTVSISGGNLFYTPPANVPPAGQTETFTYTIMDGDGDIAQGTFSIKTNDTGVSNLIAAPDILADDDDVVGFNGNAAGLNDAGLTVTSGAISYTLGADAIGSVVLSTAGNTTPLQTLAGDTVNTFWDVGTETLIGYTGGDSNIPANQVFKIAVTDINDTGADYTFTLLKPIKHLDDNANDENNSTPFDVIVTVKDADDLVGATTTFEVVIDDDTPIASDNSREVTSGSAQTADVQMIVDMSGSMGPETSSGWGGGPIGFNDAYYSDNRIGLARYSMEKFLLGNPQIENVQIIRFATTADAGAVWMTRLEAIDFIREHSNWTIATTDNDNPLGLGSATYYSEAITAAMAQFGDEGPRPSDQSFVYFVTDGNPSTSGANSPVGPAQQAEWEQFIEDNDIDGAFAVAFGNTVDEQYLTPVAYPSDDDNVVLIPDVSNVDLLSTTLGGLIAPESVTGNVLTDDDGSGVDGFGADGGYIKSIEIDGVTYAFDGTGTVTPSGAPPADGQVIDNNGTWIVIKTVLGGILTFHFATSGDGAAGEYTYIAPANANSNEGFQYTLVDGDGDEVSADLSITVIQPPTPPVANDDTVLTNITDFSNIVIPSSALLYNDTDANNDPLTMQTVQSPSGGTVSLGSAIFDPTPTTPAALLVTRTYNFFDATTGTTAIHSAQEFEVDPTPAGNTGGAADFGDLPTQAPVGTTLINDINAANNGNYTALSADDGSRWQPVTPPTSSGGIGDHQVMWAQFTVAETAATIAVIEVTINGHKDGSGSAVLGIWNHANSTWEQIDSDTFNGIDGNWTGSVSSDIADYLDASNRVTVALINQSANQRLDIDYIELKVTSEATTAIDDFSANTLDFGGFVYEDNFFGGTGEDADGSRIAAGDGNDGALQIDLGGNSGTNRDDMNGAFTRTFTLDAAAEVTISFRYRAQLSGQTDDDEDVHVLARIDNLDFGTGGNIHVLEGVDGGNSNHQDTGWLTYTTTVNLAAGTHELVLGGLMTEKSNIDEAAVVDFDNVTISTPATTNFESGAFEYIVDDGTFEDDATVTIVGQVGSIITGTEEDEILIGRPGEIDTLIGNGGADVFVLNGAAVDTITDYDHAEGDTIDISELLIGFDSNDPLTNYLSVEQSGADVLVKVNADGAGTDFVTVATLTGYNLADAVKVIFSDDVTTTTTI